MSKGKAKIAIIGPYPPPYGGISVHIERILTYLPTQSFDFYNIAKSSKKGKKFYGLWKYFYFLTFLFRHYNVIHYHSTSKKVRLLLSIVSFFRSNVYLHLHGESFIDTITGGGIIAHLIKLLIPKTNFIASNVQLEQFIKPFKPRSLHLFDAFIPPRYDAEIMKRFENTFKPPKSKYKICMVGWFVNYKNEDLYGFDIALNALYKLKAQFKLDVSIIASVNGVIDNDLYTAFLAKRKELSLEQSFILIETNLEEVFPLYLNTDIFIRPTNTDGNSVSIKEAQWFGTPVIASDCVVRPKDVLLFEDRSDSDLAEKIHQLINQYSFLSSAEKCEFCKTKKFSYPLIKKIYELE